MLSQRSQSHTGHILLSFYLCERLQIYRNRKCRSVFAWGWGRRENRAVTALVITKNVPELDFVDDCPSL